MPEHGGNREALLTAAIHCLQQQGYARTTARDLVAASGTNLGAIGYHFGSKEALLNEALAECCRRWLGQLSEQVAHADAPVGALETLETAYRAAVDNHPLAAAYVDAWAQAQHSPPLRDQLASHYAEFRASAAELARTMIRPSPHATASQPDPEAMAAVVVALIDGLVLQWLLDPAAVPNPTRLTEALRNLTGP